MSIPGPPNKYNPFFIHDGIAFSEHPTELANSDSPSALIVSMYDFPLHGIAQGDSGEIMLTDGIIHHVLFKDCYGQDKCLIPMLAFQFQRTGKDFQVINVRL